VVIDHGASRPTSTAVAISTLPVSGAGGTAAPDAAATPSKAENFLLVGSDSRACIDPKSPEAGGFIDRGDTGEQSDTIMVLRADPAAGQAAILSFPRDLLVKIAGTNRSNKINSAFAGGNVSRLVQTIELNFAVPIDHYVQVDFCSFKNIVDAVGGVKIPFAYPTRDLNTGLDVPEPACVSFDGTSALGYARSRHYQWSTDGGRHWQDDGTADRGRISRQQDFIKRVLQKAIDKGARSPQVAARLLDAGLKGVKLDSELRVNDLLSLAQQLRGFDPEKVRTFRIDGRGEMVGDQSVIRPLLENDLTRGILAVFRGQARLADAPDQPIEGATASATATSTAVAGAAPRTSTATSGPAAAPTTVAAPGGDTTGTTAGPTTSVVDVTQAAVGYLPPNDPTCR
jgi:LCP family protein required for cell wall assembly